MSMHRVSAALVASFQSVSAAPGNLGCINLPLWACIAPAQALAAWGGARPAQHLAGESLRRVLAGALAVTGAVMLR